MTTGHRYSLCVSYTRCCATRCGIKRHLEFERNHKSSRSKNDSKERLNNTIFNSHNWESRINLQLSLPSKCHWSSFNGHSHLSRPQVLYRLSNYRIVIIYTDYCHLRKIKIKNKNFSQLLQIDIFWLTGFVEFLKNNLQSNKF